MLADLADAHAARIHRDDLVVEAVKAPLPFANNPRIERGIAVSWHRDFQFPILALQPLAAVAVATVASAVARRVVTIVTRMPGQCGVKRLLQQTPLELPEQSLLTEKVLRLLIVRHQLFENRVRDQPLALLRFLSRHPGSPSPLQSEIDHLHRESDTSTHGIVRTCSPPDSPERLRRSYSCTSHADTLQFSTGESVLSER